LPKKIILRKTNLDNKIIVLFPEIPGNNIDECLTHDEDGKICYRDLRCLMRVSEGMHHKEACWLLENLEKEYGTLKVVKREHTKDYDERFRRLAFGK